MKQHPADQAPPCPDCDTPRKWVRVLGRRNFGGRQHTGWSPGPCKNPKCVMYGR
jgi:hypothetical protein